MYYVVANAFYSFSFYGVYGKIHTLSAQQINTFEISGKISVTLAYENGREKGFESYKNVSAVEINILKDDVFSTKTIHHFSTAGNKIFQTKYLCAKG